MRHFSDAVIVDVCRLVVSTQSPSIEQLCFHGEGPSGTLLAAAGEFVRQLFSHSRLVCKIDACSFAACTTDMLFQ